MKKVKLSSFEKQIAGATVAMYLSKNYSAADLDAARLETEVSRYIGNICRTYAQGAGGGWNTTAS